MKDRDCITVTDCDDCPFCAESAFCNHPMRPKNESSIFGQCWDQDPAPPWCPLIKADVLVQRKQE